MRAQEAEVWRSGAATDDRGACGGPFDRQLATAPTRLLALDEITDPLPATHASERIAAYRDAMQRGERFPPIAVIRLLGRYWVADGHKRLAACRALAPGVVVVEEWSVRRWLGDQGAQLLKKSRQQWRVVRQSPFDPAARMQARRLFWDTVGHWQRIGRSISTHLEELARRSSRAPARHVPATGTSVTPAMGALVDRLPRRDEPAPAPGAAGAGVMVLVATYLEAENICRLIDEVRVHLPAATILVLDDQSPDGTAEVVRERYGAVPGVEAVVRSSPRGYGSSMREGIRRFLASPASRLITIDADLSHDPALTLRMLESIAGGGVAIGSRYLDGVRAIDWPVGRLLASIFGNQYVRMLTRLPITDCTSGFRCYTRQALERLEVQRLRSAGYAFQVEALYWLWRAGCPLVEVPIVYRKRLFGESKLNLSTVVESLWLPWRLVLRRRRSAPLHTASRESAVDR